MSFLCLKLQTVITVMGTIATVKKEKKPIKIYLPPLTQFS